MRRRAAHRSGVERAREMSMMRDMIIGPSLPSYNTSIKVIRLLHNLELPLHMRRLGLKPMLIVAVAPEPNRRHSVLDRGVLTNQSDTRLVPGSCTTVVRLLPVAAIDLIKKEEEVPQLYALPARYDDLEHSRMLLGVAVGFVSTHVDRLEQSEETCMPMQLRMSLNNN